MERISGRSVLVLTFMAILIGASSSALATMVQFDYQGTLTWETGYYGPAAAEATALDPWGDGPPCEVTGPYYDPPCAPLPSQTLMKDFSLTFTLPAEIVDQDFDLNLFWGDLGTEWFATGLLTDQYFYSGSTGELNPVYNIGLDLITNYFAGLYYCADSNEGEPPGELQCYTGAAESAEFIPADAAALVSLLSAIATSPSSFGSVEFMTPFSGNVLAARQDGLGYTIPATEYADAAGTLRVTLVPVPATLALLGLGLAGLGYQRRKQIKAV